MAISKVTSGGIADGTLSVEDIKDDAVTAAKLANSINTDIATGVTGNTTANAALPKAGGAMTGAITTNSTFDGVDIATRDGVLTSTTATAAAALPKAGGSMSGNLELNDNVKAAFGQSGDLEIFHDSTNSYIKDIGTGALVLQSNSSAIVLEKTDGENMLLCNTDGAVNIYHNGSEKLATTATGVDVTGIAVTDGITSSGNITIAVNASPTLKLKRTGNNAGNGNIECLGADDSVDYKIAFAQSNGVMSFDVGGTRMLGVTSSGLCFNSDTATANALNDYEEGAWTPAISATSGNAATLTVGSAMYTKIGRQVNVTAYIHSIDLSAITSGSYILLTGLPYASQDYADFSIGYRDAGYSNSVIVGGYVQSGQSFAYFMHGGGGEAQQGSTFTFGKCMLNITYPST